MLLRKILQFCMLLILGISLLTNLSNGNAMEPNQALKLAEVFGKTVRDNAYLGRMVVDARGGWVTRVRGGTFRYDPVKKTLIFSSFIASGVVAFADVPELWNNLERHGKRMPKVMGDGYFEIIREGPFLNHTSFPLLMLSKNFSDGSITHEQFVMEAQWLLYGGAFWGGGPKPYGVSGVITEPEAVLIKVAEEIQKERPPRPW
jgi:hypothetical protein